MFERAVCFTHGSPRSMFERQGACTSVATESSVADTCSHTTPRCQSCTPLLAASSAFIREKTDISVFPRRPSTITQAAPICAIYSLRHAAGHQLEPALAGSLMIQYPAQSYLLVHWRCTFGWVSLLMFISRLFDHEMERIRIRGCLF